MTFFVTLSAGLEALLEENAGPKPEAGPPKEGAALAEWYGRFLAPLVRAVEEPVAERRAQDLSLRTAEGWADLDVSLGVVRITVLDRVGWWVRAGFNPKLQSYRGVVMLDEDPDGGIEMEAPVGLAECWERSLREVMKEEALGEDLQVDPRGGRDRALQIIRGVVKAYPESSWTFWSQSLVSLLVGVVEVLDHTKGSVEVEEVLRVARMDHGCFWAWVGSLPSPLRGEAGRLFGAHLADEGVHQNVRDELLGYTWVFEPEPTRVLRPGTAPIEALS